MHFESHRPHSLPGLVEQIWEQRSRERQRWSILPTGWVELIFRLGPRFSLESARVLRPDAEPLGHFCFLSGLHTRPLELSFEAFHVFGVRLHPVAVRALFGMPCEEVRDGAVEGDLLMADLARIEDRLRSAPGFRRRAQWMERELSRRLRNSDALVPAERMRRLAAMLPRRGGAPGREVSSLHGYSRSHTHRIFTEWLGQSVTATIRMNRFVRATRALHHAGRSLSEIGARVGYYDQSHFIRDFREYAAMTPGEYRDRKSAAPGQLPL